MNQYAQPLLFLRHGATQWNEQGRYQGMRDTCLSQRGRDDARSISTLLRKIVEGGEVDRKQMTLVSSPLQRAQQTANILAGNWKPALPLVKNEAFRELSMGRWEGLTSLQVKQRYYHERKSRKTDRWTFKPGGGESMAGRCAEIAAAVNELPAHSVVVTHSVVLRIIFHLLGGLEPEAAAVQETPHRSIWCWKSVKLHRHG